MTRSKAMPVLGFLAVGALLGAAALRPSPAPAGPPAAVAAERPEVADGQEAHTDQYGDPLPAGALARMGTVRWHHHDGILSLAVSPDGKLAATGGGHLEFSEQGVIRLWDLTTGKEVRQFPGRWAVFSPDGRLLASNEGYKNPNIHICEVASGKELRVLRPGYLGGLFFSPDGKALAYQLDEHTTCLWETATGKTLRRFEGEPRAFSPDGTELATSTNTYDGVALWEVATGKQVARFPGQKDMLRLLLFAPNGKALVLWSLHVEPPKAQHHEVVSWLDRVTGKELHRVQGRLLASSPGGKELAIVDGREVQLWDADEGKMLRSVPVLGVHYFQGGLTPNGKVLVATEWNTIRLQDTQTGQEIQPVPGHATRTGFVSFSPDGKGLISGGASTLRFWEVETGKQVRQIRVHWPGPVAVATSRDGRILAEKDGETAIGFWNGRTGEEVGRLVVTANDAQQLALSPDGKTVASVFKNGDTEQCLIMRDTTSGRELRRFGYVSERYIGRGQVYALVFSRDGRVLAEVRETVINLWYSATGRLLQKVARPDFRSNEFNGSPAISLSPDGRIFAASWSEHRVGLWETASGQAIRQLKGHTGRVWVVAFSPNGEILASGSQDGTVRLWNVASGSELGCLRGHRGGITALAFSPEGVGLASGSQDTTALVWDVAALAGKRRQPLAQVTPTDLETLWSDLGARDTATAYAALWKLSAVPEQAVPFLRKQLSLAGQHLDRLIADLDAEEFDVRARASGELEELGREAEGGLRRALEGHPSAELRRRAKQLLENLSPAESERLAEAEAEISRLLEGTPSVETHREVWRLLENLPTPGGEHQAVATLRVIRAVQVLEQVGTAEACTVLQELGRGQPRARLTREANAALERLAKRSATAP